MKVWELIFSTTFLATVIRMTTPILFAGLAGLIASQAGVMNLAVESIMLTSALAGVLISAWTGSAWIGLLGAVLIGIGMGFVIAYTAFTLHADMVLNGVAFNLMMTGGTVFLLYVATGQKGTSTGVPSKVLPTVNIPLLKDIPYVGEVLSGHNVLTYIAVAFTILMFYYLFKTKIGLRIRMVGENPAAAESVGINSKKIKYLAMCLSGMFAALGGAYMSMAYMSWFQNNITAGRGFIGMAASALGGNMPLGTLMASLLFGVADAVANTISSLNLPSELVSMLPYVITIIGLVYYSIYLSKRKAPASKAKEEPKPSEEGKETI